MLFDNVESVKNIDCIVYAPLNVFKDGIVVFSSELVASRLFMVEVLLHRLEVVELLKDVVCYLCTGHVVCVMTIFVILVGVH